MLHWFPSFPSSLFLPIFVCHPKPMERGRKSLLGASICVPEEGRQERWGMGVGDMLVICAVFCISLFPL